MHEKISDQYRASVAEFYDAVAGPFSGTRQYWWQDLEFIGKYYRFGDRIVDFGCGNGRLLELIKAPVTDYLGLDISEKLLDQARIKYPTYKFTHIENESSLPLSTGEIDCVYTIAVFHHLNAVMALNALNEIKRVLKPGGKIILSAWYLWSWSKLKYLLPNWLRLSFGLSAKIPFRAGDQVFQRLCYWWTLVGLKKIARQANLKIIESGYTKGASGEKRNMYLVLEK